MSDRDYWDSSSTQRAHLKSARDSARAVLLEPEAQERESVQAV